MQARLVRKIPVRVLDVSLSGCQVATNHAFTPGTAGELSVELGNLAFRTPLRFVRALARHGSSHAVTLGGVFAA